MTLQVLLIVLTLANFIAAGDARSISAQPNITSSVTFSRTTNNTLEDWTWRINITDHAVPNDWESSSQDAPADFSEGLRVVTTTWDLEPPGLAEDESFGNWMTARGWEGVRITGSIASKPARVIDGYSDADGGNCTHVLGEQCMASLVDYVSNSQLPSVDFSSLEGCADTLNAPGPYAPDGQFGEDISAASATSSGSVVTLYNSSSLPLEGNSGDFARQINNAKVNMHILTLMPLYDNASGTDSTRASVLCRIVDKEAALAKVSGAGTGWNVSMQIVCGALVLSSFAVLWS